MNRDEYTKNFLGSHTKRLDFDLNTDKYHSECIHDTIDDRDVDQPSTPFVTKETGSASESTRRQ